MKKKAVLAVLGLVTAVCVCLWAVGIATLAQAARAVVFWWATGVCVLMVEVAVKAIRKPTDSLPTVLNEAMAVLAILSTERAKGEALLQRAEALRKPLVLTVADALKPGDLIEVDEDGIRKIEGRVQ